MSGPAPTDRAERRLRPPTGRVARRAVTYWTVRAVPGWVGLIAAAIAVTGRLDVVPGGWPATAVLVVLAALAHLLAMPRWRYRVHRWEITDQAVYTQSGWFTVERRIAPISRIQSVDVQRGPLEQVFGLANLTVTTASAAGPLQISGLRRADAERLSDQLTATTQAVAGDAT